MDIPMSEAELAASQGLPIISSEEERSGRARWVAELQERPEFYIVGSLSTSAEATPSDTVRRLTELTHACGADEIGDHCWYTACCLLEVIAQTAPEEQSRLVAFVHQLRATTVTCASTGQPIDCKGQIVWRDLPTFGYTIADELGSFSGLENEYSAEDVQRWESLISFFAQLDASSEEPELDLSRTHALTAFDWAFESPAPTGPTEVSVQLACLWFIFDAAKMYRKVSSGQIEEFSFENWNRWRRGLVGAKSRGYDSRTNALVDAALECITNAEAGV